MKVKQYRSSKRENAKYGVMLVSYLIMFFIMAFFVLQVMSNMTIFRGFFDNYSELPYFSSVLTVILLLVALGLPLIILGLLAGTNPLLFLILFGFPSKKKKKKKRLKSKTKQYISMLFSLGVFLFIIFLFILYFMGFFNFDRWVI